MYDDADVHASRHEPCSFTSSCRGTWTLIENILSACGVRVFSYLIIETLSLREYLQLESLLERLSARVATHRRVRCSTRARVCTFSTHTRHRSHSRLTVRCVGAWGKGGRIAVCARCPSTIVLMRAPWHMDHGASDHMARASGSATHAYGTTCMDSPDE